MDYLLDSNVIIDFIGDRLSDSALISTDKILGISDLIIAATALEYNLELITHNLNDFKNIDGVIITDSHKF